MKSLPADLETLAGAGKGALARVLSALETRMDDPTVAGLLDAANAAPRGIVLGLTGPPGVGKSTLVNALTGRLRESGRTVAVVAVDPSSHRSGGAILGDRTRIETDPDDAGVFVRSMAARRHLGGLADITFPATVLMRALYDVVLVETVGVGQSETEIVNCADIVVFCAQPGSGDALQFMKAGIAEVPDLVLVTKGDMGAPARQAAADIKGALSLSSRTGAPPEVLIVSSRSGEGIAPAIGNIVNHAENMEESGLLTEKRQQQTRLWVESRLSDSFGQVGLLLINRYLTEYSNPFKAVSDLSERASLILHELVESLWKQ